jgi:hypothetical protein
MKLTHALAVSEGGNGTAGKCCDLFFIQSVLASNSLIDFWFKWRN